jgi:hypothetical protein
MQDNSISKVPPVQQSMNYNLLRNKGIDYLQLIAGNVWTDYNVHDPGVTILEMLCYALTDLGTRANYDIKDILAKENNNGLLEGDFYTNSEILTNFPFTINDYRKLIIDQPNIRNAWISRSTLSEKQISVNPNTLSKTLSYEGEDLIYLNGLYNVQLEFEEDAVLGDLNSNILYITILPPDSPPLGFPVPDSPPIESFSEQVAVTFPFWDQASPVWLSPVEIIAIHLDLNVVEPGEEYFSEFTVKYKGYNDAESTENLGVYIQLPASLKDKDPAGIEAALEAILSDTSSGGVLKKFNDKMLLTSTLVNNIRALLNDKRNLCEDFLSFTVVRVQEISIEAEIELSVDSNSEQTLSQFYYKIDKFLNPSVSFYSLSQMLAKGKDIGEVFEGPVLNHGFIDDDELNELKRADVIYTSDLIKIMMGIDGVIAVKNLNISNYINNQPITKNVINCLKLVMSSMYKPRLSINKSLISVNKSSILTDMDIDIINTEFNKLKSADLATKNIVLAKDPVFPVGEYKFINEYYTIQNDFPRTYGIGKAGLSDNAPGSRKAQAKQMRAYLLFFEQLLVNYFAQLANINSLFSISSDVNSTYFAQPLYTVPKVEELINGLATGDYMETLEEITENNELFVQRRNRFLNHILARFGEDSQEFSLLAYLNGRNTGLYEIDQKLAFLNQLPLLSSFRSGAYNYTAENLDNSPDVWDTFNVSGLEKRVSMLLGFKNTKRRDLVRDLDEYFINYQEPGDFPSDQRFKLINENGTGLLKSRTALPTLDLWTEAVESVIRLAAEEENFLILMTADGKYYFSLIEENYAEIAVSTLFFDDEEEVRDAVKNLISFINENYNEEGFYLIEHILLRPVFNEPAFKDEFLLPILGYIADPVLGYKEDITPEGRDPYSFRISAIFPGYISQFQDKTFRTRAERLLRTETPAHILADIYWIKNKEDMADFQEIYKEWITIFATLKEVNDTEKQKLSDAKNKLINRLNNLNMQSAM